MDSHDVIPWSEGDSAHFLEVGRVHIPARDEIQATILDLLPVSNDPFLVVELGIGGGWLSEAILDHFKQARILGLDASSTMLRATDERLRRFRGRFTLQPFHLEDRSWLKPLEDVRAFVSSLVIHHIDGPAKCGLYREMYQRLETPGAVLIADLVAPRTERERRYMADRWDSEVERQSLELTGSLDIYRRFRDDHDNWYRYPDPMDRPSTIPEHLTWLEEAGFTGANVFWERAGHAVYGGFRD